jgi:hypothetical protein
MSRVLWILVAAAATLALAAPSQARNSHHTRWSSMTLHERRVVVVREVARQRAPVRWWLHRRRSLESTNVYPLCVALGTAVPGPICSHGQRLVHALGVLHRIDAKLAARAAAARAAAEPAHLAGWLCIHYGRHPGVPGDPHEGTGWNGQYSGPLQMHPYWGGYPVTDWNALPEMQVYADAEKVAAAQGFSYSWMAGQWPNTFPPCADLF